LLFCLVWSMNVEHIYTLITLKMAGGKHIRTVTVVKVTNIIKMLVSRLTPNYEGSILKLSAWV